MPTYEYQCERCNHIFEVVKSMSKYDRKEKCPCCRVDAKRKISTGQGFILKGDGFHDNDYPKNRK